MILVVRGVEEFKAVLLGVLQGITEFLPISSSGHIVFAKEYIGFEIGSLPFTICLHMGSLFAILFFFRRYTKGMIMAMAKGLMEGRCREWVASKEGRLLLLIILGTLPIFCIGPLIRSGVERIFDLPGLVGGLLIVNGMILWVAERYSPPQGRERIGVREALLIGCAQVVGTLPGISRSGITIATGMLAGIERESAASYSFLLAILAILGANAMEFIGMERTLGVEDGTIFYYLLGGLVAFCVSLLSLRLLFWALKRRRFSIFSPYCLSVGLLMLVVEWVRT